MPKNFNPLPPWGGRQKYCINDVIILAISIHSLRGEGDWVSGCTCKWRIRFQSTPSVGRETPDVGNVDETTGISIHSLRGEGDKS